MFFISASGCGGRATRRAATVSRTGTEAKENPAGAVRAARRGVRGALKSPREMASAALDSAPALRGRPRCVLVVARLARTKPGRPDSRRGKTLRRGTRPDQGDRLARKPFPSPGAGARRGNRLDADSGGAAREWADAEHLPGFEHEHCFDPGTNTLAGTWYLGKLLRRYAQTDDPLPYALADYNAGRGNVLKWNQGAAATNSAAFIEQIGFPGTRDYVRSVMRRYARYQPVFRLDAP